MNPYQFKRFRDYMTQAGRGVTIELGVFRGETLKLMCQHRPDDPLIGIDTFAGMPEPGEHDIVDGVSHYPKGRLAATMREAQRAVPAARLIAGTIPEVFGDLVIDQPIAFAHVDLDHYRPTLEALRWLWFRVRPGGVIACDDWFPGRDYLASRAIAEWSEITGAPIDQIGKKGFFVR